MPHGQGEPIKQTSATLQNWLMNVNEITLEGSPGYVAASARFN